MLGILENHHSFRSWLPRLEKITFDVSVVHFLLMFGYKLFSLYYPIFLISLGFSLVDVGGVYLVTYSAISFFSIVISHYRHKLDPVLMAVSGILGYGIFSSMMLLGRDIFIFYSAQIVIGFSAAAWMTSLKLMLMESKPAKDNSGFGWFYSMPHYAAVVAPAVGGLIIWKFGFVGVFSASVLVHVANAFYAYLRLSADSELLKKISISRKKRNMSRDKLRSMFKMLQQQKYLGILTFTLLSALMLVGVYRAFFVIFLESLSFKKETIIQIISISSILYLPFSFFAIKAIAKLKSYEIIYSGVLAEGSTSIFLGILSPMLNFFGFLFVMIMDSFGVLLADMGKSSFLSDKLKDHHEEASIVDTVISTLFPALGSLAGGIIISLVGYQNTFMFFGTIVLISGFVSFFCFSKK